MTHENKPVVAHGHDAALNPRTKGYEFFGPPGTLLVSISVPLLTYVFSLQCSEKAGGCPRSWVELPTEFKLAVTDPDWWESLWDTEAFLVYFGWYTFCLVAWAVLPGDWVEGYPMRNGKKLKYKINGKSHTTYLSHGAHRFSFITAFSTYLLALGLAVGVIINFGPASFTYIHDHWIGLVTAALINSVVQAFIWYAWSFRPGHLLALGGNTGNHLYDVCRSVHSRYMTTGLKTVYSGSLVASSTPLSALLKSNLSMNYVLAWFCGHLSTCLWHANRLFVAPILTAYPCPASPILCG
jgi:hypothetical protein